MAMTLAQRGMVLVKSLEFIFAPLTASVTSSVVQTVSSLATLDAISVGERLSTTICCSWPRSASM